MFITLNTHPMLARFITKKQRRNTLTKKTPHLHHGRRKQPINKIKKQKIQKKTTNHVGRKYE